MSFGHPDVVLHHSRARGTDKVILIGIASHDGDGGAWPSIATLARYGNVDERSVKRSLQRLVDLGELAVERGQGGDRETRNDRRPNRYHVLVECPADCAGGPWHRQKRAARAKAPRGDESVTPSDGRRGDTGVTSSGSPRGDADVMSSAARGDASDRDGVTLMSPEINPGKGSPLPPHRRPSCSRHRRWMSKCTDCQAAKAAVDSPAKTRPAWCGECDEHTRHRCTPEGDSLGRCRSCHPLAAETTTQDIG